MEQIIIGGFEQLGGLVGGRRAVVVVDEKVAELYAMPFESVVVRAREQEKTLATVECIVGQLIEMGANRDTFLVGVGGGIVCDIAGFAASVYMRGVGYGLVPTTLLAQVDAAIGGKNGVNVGGYKNMAGRFSIPEFVLCDADFLGTLPPREMRSGMAEVVKAAIIGDPELFEILERRDFSMEDVVRRAAAVKVAIVERDRYENGERRLLNLGHTLGHAIEKAAPAGFYTHGEAVSIGIAYAARGLKTEERIVALLTSLGLPTSTDLDPALLENAMRADKKGELFVYPEEIGRCVVR